MINLKKKWLAVKIVSENYGFTVKMTQFKLNAS